MKIRVVLADDQRMFREVLKIWLTGEPDIEIIAETGSGADTLATLEQIVADVLVLDVEMGDITGIDIARKVTKLYPALRIIALSGHAERIYVEEMLKAGSQGYVAKSSGPGELVTAIRAVMAGQNYLSSEVMHTLIRRIQADERTATPPSSVLGSREREILKLLAGGKGSADIASSLGIAEATVKTHRRNIKQKLGLFSTAELTRYAIREGLISS